MAEPAPLPIRERILAALATLLTALRNPDALDYDDTRLIALYDEDEALVDEWDNVLHQMTVRLTALDRYDESLVAKGTAANHLLADLQTLAVSQRTLSGLCENITVQQAAPAYSDDPSAFIGALIELRITYRTAPGNLYANP